MTRLKFFLLLCLAALAFAGCQKVPKPNGGNGQETKPPHFTADLPDEFLLDYGKHDHTWTVDTDIKDWTVTSDQAWCQCQAVANGLLIIVDAYEEKDAAGNDLYLPPRVCTLTVKAGTTFNKTVKIIQETHLEMVLPEAENGMLSFELSPDGGSREVVVRCNAYGWTASSEASWLSFERKDNATLLVKSAARGENETDRRSAEVKVYIPNEPKIYWYFTVSDAPTTFTGVNLDYGDHTNWD